MSLIQVIPLGGSGEIGKNCTVVRQGDEMIVVDCGLSFPHEEHYGVDIVIPDFRYLVENREKVKGIFLTHAHEDHVGALAFLLQELNVPIFCTQFTEALVRSKLDERHRGLDVVINRIKPGDIVPVGDMSVEPILVTHSIPETCALAVRTVHGIVLFTADFKFDFSPVDGRLTNLARLAEIGEEGVLLLMSDSTNVDRPGWGPSESTVTLGLRSVFESAPGRVLITTFSSNIHRMQQAFDVAKETGRRVSVAGRRMDTVIQLCAKLGYLKIPEGVFVPLADIGKYPANEISVLITGSQGEPMAALSQMSRGEYSRMRIEKGDTILYSARPIPGNEGAIWRTVNRIFKMGANVITDHKLPIHCSGHAYEDELKMMVNLVRPFYVAPVHGEPRHQYLFREMLLGMGHAEHRIFTLANGDSLCLDDEKAWIGEPVPVGEILIDQHGDVPVTDNVLSERSSLGHEGVIVVSLAVDGKSGSLESRPEAVAKGYSGPEAAILDGLDDLMAALNGMTAEEIRNRTVLESTIREMLKRSIHRHCRQRPVVIPAIVGI